MSWVHLLGAASQALTAQCDGAVRSQLPLRGSSGLLIKGTGFPF